ncbi:Colicin V production protein [Magnetococcus marinus MC-1]|uniref:Colicin V production protein n=1 Tax=Magnetococcus marinus (strain ATCC BAA-1437 / JCM 17883 / MC-1) TaxID=156889 RepID=A0L498_MAGMM|nr:CvpA family protein [Magnetococcus marinus]ABK42791.1 Colicin V production protein [Magnetococcus marinus MC-1]
MIWFDYLLIFILGSVLLLAANRGFFREVFALIGWVLAFIATTFLSGRLAAHLGHYVADAEMVRIMAISLVFISTLMAVWGIGYLLNWAIAPAQLNWQDRILGMSFGLVRGMLVILIGFSTVMAFGGPPQGVMKRSVLAQHFAQGAWRLSILQPSDSMLRVQGDERPTRIQTVPVPTWEADERTLEAWLHRPLEAPPAELPAPIMIHKQVEKVTRLF